MCERSWFVKFPTNVMLDTAGVCRARSFFFSFLILCKTLINQFTNMQTSLPYERRFTKISLIEDINKIHNLLYDKYISVDQFDHLYDMTTIELEAMLTVMDKQLTYSKHSFDFTFEV